MLISESRSRVLFEELVQELIKEGQETGQFQIDSMQFAQMEMFGHGLGKELARRVQEALTESQSTQMDKSFDCPTCQRECRAVIKGKSITSLDGDIETTEVRCYCKKCRRSFFPST